MANKKVDKGSTIQSISSLFTNLMNLSKNTNYNTYKVSSDLYDIEKSINKLDELQERNKDSIKNTVDGNNYANSRVNSFGLIFGNNTTADKNNKDKGNAKNLFELINQDNTLFSELKQHLLLNNKFYETIADYELLRRAIPEISRVINLLINSVIIPEVISSETYNLSYDFNDRVTTELNKKLREKYEIDKKIRTIVENYFVIGTEYITVVPYKAVVEAIKSDSFNTSSRKKLLKESSLQIDTKNSMIITESVFIDSLDEKEQASFNKLTGNIKTSEMKNFNNSMNEYIGSINIYKSNKKLMYESAIVDAVSSDSSFMFESSFEEFFSDSKKMKMKKNSNDGLNIIDDKDYDNLKITGCKIERLDPARVFPLRIKDTIVAYIYLEERRDDALQYNLQSNIKNNFSFSRSGLYNGSTEYNLKLLENRMIKEIGGRILANLSPKFLEVNFDNMDILYEFLRDNHIHRVQKDIIMLHPDDVIEFKRSDGSLMKNAVFFAKLYLLMIINNILIKVRKGSDRTLYYVDNGLSNDIEGSVMAAIQAIQQSQVRLSDVGTIAGIIGAVGSTVDLFIPQSSDGSKPINTEIVPGQTVQMDEDFLQFLIKSIILSFNMPPNVVDTTSDVEFAKTIAASNLEVATSTALSQAELNPPLTELFKKIMLYELDLTEEEVESIKATLIPSRSMLIQMTGDLINTTKDLANNLADINILGDDENLKKMFVKEFVRKYYNYDWDSIDEILSKIKEELIADKLKTDAETATTTATEPAIGEQPAEEF